MGMILPFSALSGSQPVMLTCTETVQNNFHNPQRSVCLAELCVADKNQQGEKVCVHAQSLLMLAVLLCDRILAFICSIWGPCSLFFAALYV